MSIKYDFIKRMQELEPNYDFSKFNYTYSRIKSTIICDKGHEFEMCWNNFREGQRCPVCYYYSKFNNKEESINKLKNVHSDYDFSKFEYNGCKGKGLTICDKGHEFYSRYDHLINGSRCPHCKNKVSKPETEIIEFIKTFYNGTIEQSNRNIIKNHMTNRYLELDIYLPELNKSIEFNGRYYHTDDKAKVNGWNSVEEKHIMKTIYCKGKGIDLIHIFEDKWIDDKDKELNRIKEFLCQ